MPARDEDDTHTTGVIIPRFIPLWIPSMSSFWVNASPSKNFSISVSSVSATASLIASTSPSIRYCIFSVAAAAGRSVSIALPLPSYLYAFISIRFTYDTIFSFSITGTTTGHTVGPKTVFSSVRTL